MEKEKINKVIEILEKNVKMLKESKIGNKDSLEIRIQIALLEKELNNWRKLK